jgi:hypothetical protein
MSQAFDDKVKRFTDTRMTKQFAADEVKARAYAEMAQELRASGFVESVLSISREDLARCLYVAHGGELPSMEGHFRVHMTTYLNMADAALLAVKGEFRHES